MCDDDAGVGPLLYFVALIKYCGGAASGCVGTRGVENTVSGFGMAFGACVFGVGANRFFGVGAMAGSGTLLFAAGGWGGSGRLLFSAGGWGGSGRLLFCSCWPWLWWKALRADGGRRGSAGRCIDRDGFGRDLGGLHNGTWMALWLMDGGCNCSLGCWMAALMAA